ncbi:MAG: hypothetical protein AAFZ15_29190 [Bacteroidota bacterium]
MKFSIRLFLLLMLALPFYLNGQNAKERIQNRSQIAEGKKNLERDTRELAAFKAKTTAFETAFQNRNLELVRKLKMDLLTDMKREIEQGKVKAAQARREVAQSSAEVRSERREIRRNVEDSNTTRRDRQDDKRDMARDRINKADDKADRRDDIRDQKAIVERVEKQSKILQTLTAYTFSLEDGVLEKAIANKALIAEFTRTMEADIVATKQELGEDVRENREDRRETRDDRQERNERDTRIKNRGRN